MFGRCPREMALSKHEDEWMTTLAHKQIVAFNAGHGWFFWNFRTEFEAHWDFLESWRRGWFPRNVSDLRALDALHVCDEGAPPLMPTASHSSTDGGIYGGSASTPWLIKYWLPALIGAVVGALLAVGATRLAAHLRWDALHLVPEYLSQILNPSLCMHS